MLFWAKKNTSCFDAIKGQGYFVFSSIVTKNIQKTLQPTRAGLGLNTHISSANIR